LQINILYGLGAVENIDIITKTLALALLNFIQICNGYIFVYLARGSS